MFYELRQYRAHPGQRENWVRYMEEVIIPFQTEKGMTILGSFTGQEEDDLFVWIRNSKTRAIASGSTKRSTRAITGRM